MYSISWDGDALGLRQGRIISISNEHLLFQMQLFHTTHSEAKGLKGDCVNLFNKDLFTLCYWMAMSVINSNTHLGFYNLQMFTYIFNIKILWGSKYEKKYVNITIIEWIVKKKPSFSDI